MQFVDARCGGQSCSASNSFDLSPALVHVVVDQLHHGRRLQQRADVVHADPEQLRNFRLLHAGGNELGNAVVPEPRLSRCSFDPSPHDGKRMEFFFRDLGRSLDEGSSG
jgi:hypothetical protein